jgi:tRNA1Val (adenine37-N6)-methyltransferase
VVGLEIQEALADRAMRGVRLNGLEGRVCVVRGDVRDADRFFRPGIFDAIISNPPYHEPGRGKISLEREKALSRHQTMMPLEDLFRVSTSLLKPSGRLSLIYPASQVNRIMKVIEDTGFTLSRVLWIHSHESAQPVLLCVEAGVQCAPQQERTGRLYLYQARGIRTRIAEAILAGDSVDCTF